jgi:hypothetical protein
MTSSDTSTRYPMGPTGEREEPNLLWVDQLSQEVLLTVQAFQRLQAAWQGKVIGTNDG